MSDTRVARLTLRASDEGLVRRGAILVEDAMRIATLEVASDQRLLIIKHFDLGEIAAEAPSHTLALQIEARLAGVRSSAVEATSPAATAAAAVWFADEPTAIAQLARRIAAGPPPREWFWKHVAGNAVAQPMAQGIAQCVRAALALPQGVLALARLVEAIEDARDGAFLGELTQSDGAGLLAMMFGATEPARGPSTSVNLGGLGTAWLARVVRWTGVWGRDARARWLATIALIASRGTVGTPAMELARAETLLTVIAPPPRRAPPSREPAHDAPEAAAVAPVPAAAPAIPGVTREMSDDDAARTAVAAARIAAPMLAARAQAEASVRQRDAVRPPDKRPPPRPRLVPDAPRPAPSDEVAAASSVAGTLFLVRPLALLGMPAWLAEHPWAEDSAFALRLLARIADRYLVNPAAEDPLVAALAGAPGTPAITDGDFTSPAVWRALTGASREIRTATDGKRIVLNGSWPLAAGAFPMADDEPRLRARAWAAVAWERALHRWLRAHAGVSLGWLVRRTATVIATPTHLELAMPLRAVDIHVRAAGLDVDPGWVPWLGRVIRFHYRGGPR